MATLSSHLNLRKRCCMSTSPENYPSPPTTDQNIEISSKIKSPAQACAERWALESQKRHEWIAVAAYFKAERRDFAPNHELDDWLEAELEFARRQVEEYLCILEEDGEATLIGLQLLAHSLGVEHPEHIHSKTDLIQAIQCACQLLPCYRTDIEELCSLVPDCQWRTECKKVFAEWKSHERKR